MYERRIEELEKRTGELTNAVQAKFETQDFMTFNDLDAQIMKKIEGVSALLDGNEKRKAAAAMSSSDDEDDDDDADDDDDETVTSAGSLMNMTLPPCSPFFERVKQIICRIYK